MDCIQQLQNWVQGSILWTYNEPSTKGSRMTTSFPATSLFSVMLVISSLAEIIKYGHATLINILLSLSPTLLQARKYAMFEVWQSILIFRCHSHLYVRQKVPICFLLQNITWNQITFCIFRYTICDQYISINVTEVTHSTWSQFNFGPFTCQ